MLFVHWLILDLVLLDAEWNLVAGGSSRQFHSTFLSHCMTGLPWNFARICCGAFCRIFSFRLSVPIRIVAPVSFNLFVPLHDRP